MTTTETHFFNLLWATDVDRRLTAAVALDRSIRASVETLTTLLAAYVNHRDGPTRPRLIQEAAETLHSLTGILAELETSVNVRLPDLRGPSTQDTGD
jgi:hypothetical protein